MFFDWFFNDLFGKSDLNLNDIFSPELSKEVLGVDSKSIITSYHITGDTVDVEYTVTDEDVDKAKKIEELIDKWQLLTDFYPNMKITIKFNDKDVFEYIWDDKQKCFIEKIYTIPEYKEALGNSICPSGDGDGNSNKKKEDEKEDEKVEAVIRKGLNELNKKIEKKTLAQELNDRLNFANNLEKKLNIEEDDLVPVFIPESASDIFTEYIIGGEHFEKVKNGKKTIGIKFSILDLIVNNDDTEENRKKLRNIVTHEDKELIAFCEILQKKYGFTQVVWDMYTVKNIGLFGSADKHRKRFNVIDLENGNCHEIDDIEFTAYF